MYLTIPICRSSYDWPAFFAKPASAPQLQSPTFAITTLSVHSHTDWCTFALRRWDGDTGCISTMSRVYDDDKPSPSMADEPQHGDLAGSSATFPTDSENYSSSHNDLSPSPPSSSTSPMILYSPPTIWGLLRGAAINLLLPFVNGLMLGLGELLAHEAAFRLGWSGTKVRVRLPGHGGHIM